MKYWESRIDIYDKTRRVCISTDVFQLSAAYIAVGSTNDVYRRNFTILLMSLDDQISRSLWESDTALPILTLTSAIASPSLEM